MQICYLFDQICSLSLSLSLSDLLTCIGTSWDELKHVRQAVGFLVIHQKSRISYDEITNDLCLILSVQQLYRVCTLYCDDNYNTPSVSPDLELFLSSGTVSLSIYSLVAGIFGMNIPYTWNDHYGYMFKWVVICAGAFCAIIFVPIISYARYKGLVGS